jgi:hypothetical protein
MSNTGGWNVVAAVAVAGLSPTYPPPGRWLCARNGLGRFSGAPALNGGNMPPLCLHGLWLGQGRV